MNVTRNIFTIGRRVDDEDQLTEMLAWLCEMVPQIRAVLCELAGVPAPDPEAITVRTQHTIPGGCLDALLESDGTAVILESKLKTTFSVDQLEKYCRWLAAQRPDADRFLLTLTRAADPWRASALAAASDLDVAAVPRRWQDLYGQLSALAEDPGLYDHARHLTDSFAAMLAAEGLIPIAAIQPDEFTAWAASATVVGRFHDYFDAAKPTMANALDAKASGSRQGLKSPGYTWQGFQTSYEWFVYLGIWASSERWPPRTGTGAGSEPVFGTALLKPPDERVTVASSLTPVGWTGGAVPALYGNSGIWRPLGTVLTGSGLGQQLDGIASACAEIKAWAQSAYSAHVQSQESVPAP